ncbi:MAG TPA: hypothetical protein DCS09_10645 [Porphyromonadaceae bacterium]|nr:hypothetical protein [Porphyromonadaceae bacterium]
MTIEYETLRTGVYAGKVLCKTCDRHQAFIHKGYGNDAEPLDREDREILDEAASRHDKANLGQHTIMIYLFTP